MKKFLFLLLLAVGVSATGFSQVKIGYTNIEVILPLMPEAKTVDAELETYQRKLAERIKIKDDYANQKLQEYQELKAANRLSPADAKLREEELMKLDQEIQEMAGQAEYEIAAKRAELLNPILDKIQKAIDDTAKEKGYTYILNQTTSSGVSTILYGPEEDDVTEAILKKLGISIPANGGN